MSTEESLTDLPTPNLPENPILEVQKSNFSGEDIYNVINDITNILETALYDLGTDSFIEDFEEPKQNIFKNRENYSEKSKLISTIAVLKIKNQNLKDDLYDINNLTEKQNTFQTNKERLLPSSNTKYIKKKHTEEKAIELNNRCSVLEDKYQILEQEIYDNQQSYKYLALLLNKRKPKVVTNQYPKNDHLLHKDGESLADSASKHSVHRDFQMWGKSFMISTSMVKGLKVKDMNRNLRNTSVEVRPFQEQR